MRTSAPHQRVDGKVHFDNSDQPELYEPWRDAINDCIYAEEGRLPYQVVYLDVSDADFVPREIKGFFQNDLEWIAIQDFNASFEIPDTMRKYVACYFVEQI
jgi:hypothetical protein